MRYLSELIEDAGFFGPVVVVLGLPAAVAALAGFDEALRAPDRAATVATALGAVGLLLLAIGLAAYAFETRSVEEALAAIDPKRQTRLMIYGQSALHGLRTLGFAAAALPLAGAAGAAGRALAKGASPVPDVAAGMLFVGVLSALGGLVAHHLVKHDILRSLAVSAETPAAMKAVLLAGQGSLRIARGLSLVGIALATLGAGLTQIQS